MVEGGRVDRRVDACMARAMDQNVTNEADHPEFEREVDDSEQTRYITWRTEQEGERNQSLILQPVSRNGAGRKGKGKIETRHGGKERPTNMSALKLIARQGADEKAQLEEWKTSLMEGLTSEITQLQKSHEEAMEAQREEMERQRNQFQFEIEMLGERIRELEEKRGGSTEGHKENRKRATPDPSTPEVGREVTQRPRDMSATPNLADRRGKFSDKTQSYASVAAAKPIRNSEQPWTKVSYGNRKTGTTKSSPIAKTEQRGRRILFPRKKGSEHKSEADLMLALNEALQKAGVGTKVRFCRVRYAPSGSVSALLTEQADAVMLLPQYLNLFIRAAKSVDQAVVGVEVLEHWQRLKVHGMSLARYLGPEKLELVKREVEFSTGISLKAIPRWLINEDRLKEQQEVSNKQGSAIFITVSNELEAKQLCADGLRFGGTVKKVEKFWQAGPGSVCMRCCGIGHERCKRLTRRTASATSPAMHPRATPRETE